MNRSFCFLFLVIAAGLSEVQAEERTWTNSEGRTMKGELLSFDGTMATIRSGGQEFTVSAASLSVDDQSYLKGWKPTDHSEEDGDSKKSKEWPEVVQIDRDVEVTLQNEEPIKGRFVYHSPNYEFTSPAKLAGSMMGELALIFEATHSLLEQVPLDLKLQGAEGQRIKVVLFETMAEKEKFGDTGNDPISVRRDVVYATLPALGAKQTGSRWVVQGKVDFETLIMRLCQQRWSDMRLLSWANMGMGRYFGLIRYDKGTFKLSTHGSVVDRWAADNSRGSSVRLYDLKELMAMKAQEWNRLNKQPGSMKRMPSCVLLVHYFARLDGDGDSKHLTDYLEARRSGKSEEEAREAHLLRGRSYSRLADEMKAALAKDGIRIDID